jgi:hypothetical protein
MNRLFGILTCLIVFFVSLTFFIAILVSRSPSKRHLVVVLPPCSSDSSAASTNSANSEYLQRWLEEQRRQQIAKEQQQRERERRISGMDNLNSKRPINVRYSFRDLPNDDNNVETTARVRSPLDIKVVGEEDASRRPYRSAPESDDDHHNDEAADKIPLQQYNQLNPMTTPTSDWDLFFRNNSLVPLPVVSIRGEFATGTGYLRELFNRNCPKVVFRNDNMWHQFDADSLYGMFVFLILTHF